MQCIMTEIAPASDSDSFRACLGCMFAGLIAFSHHISLFLCWLLAIVYHNGRNYNYKYFARATGLD